jgi:hypothetical protein
MNSAIFALTFIALVMSMFSRKITMLMIVVILLLMYESEKNILDDIFKMPDKTPPPATPTVPPTIPTVPPVRTNFENFNNTFENFNTLLEKDADIAQPSSFVVDPKYKGAVEYNDEHDTTDYAYTNNNTTQYGEDKIAAYQLKHRGGNMERQIAGASNKMAIMKPMLSEELHEEEYARWWGNNDQ